MPRQECARLVFSSMHLCNTETTYQFMPTVANNMVVASWVKIYLWEDFEYILPANAMLQTGYMQSVTL